MRLSLTLRFWRRLSSFDRTVVTALAAVLATIGVLVWRGDQVGLRVVAATPAGTEVSTLTALQVVFDQPIESTPEEIRLTLDPPVAGRVQVVGDRIAFVPAGLQPATRYTVQLEAGVRGAYGRALGSPLRWQFTTSPVQVLFTRTESGREQLFAAPLPAAAAATPSPARPLTDAPGGIWDFALSPADGRIAFAALTEDGASDLWLLEPGGEPERLLDCGGNFCSSPSWSHDGDLLLFSQRNTRDVGTGAVNPPRLSILHVASGERAPIFSDSQKLGFEARWSSDNQWITYLSPDFVGIGVYNLETGAERFYPTQAGEPAPWQPGQIQFLMNEQRAVGERSAIHLFLVDPVADTRTNLSGEEALVEDGAAVWSPDGQWIAFRRNITAGPGATLSKQLWVMRSDGSAARRLTSDPEVDHGPPAWSSDGRSLVYHRFPLKGPGIVISVWQIDVFSGVQRLIATPGQRPQWLQ
jgi:Tol biopolymer transport system component